MGGQFVISGVLGKGTVVTVQLPTGSPSGMPARAAAATSPRQIPTAAIRATEPFTDLHR
jgi:hypothetical protein